jgi:hypothetical protein
MVKRMVLLAAWVLLAGRVSAQGFTDVYYDVNEPGWGAFLVQSGGFQFLAFFIYDKNGDPTWYTAQLNNDGTGNFTGKLYAITGTYFENPWTGYNINEAGTASFSPTDIYKATLKYTVNGLPTVTKPVQRQTLTPQVLNPGSNYSGSVAGSFTGCTDPAENGAFRARFVLAVTQTAQPPSASLKFTFVDPPDLNGQACTIAGPLTQYGRLYQLNGNLTCTDDPLPTPVVINELHRTSQGLEGHITVHDRNGCTQSLPFAAVLNSNN